MPFNLSLLAGALAVALSPVVHATNYNWSGGSFSFVNPAPNPLTMPDTLSIITGSNKYLNVNFSNQSTIAATDDLYFYGGNTLTNNGVYDMHGDVGLYNANGGGNFVNTGTLRKSIGTGTSNVTPSFTNTAAGKVVVNTGTINFVQPFANQGTLDFGISGLSNYGKMTIGGSPTLGGLINVHLIGSYMPSVGDAFQLITYASETGVFANTNWIFNGVTYAPVYNATNFTLDVTNVAAVAEPGEWALMLGGLALMGSIAYRRKNSNMA